MTHLELVFENYRKQLLEIKNSITETVELGEAGKITEKQAMPLLSDYEKTIQEIADCILVLHHLWKRRRS